MVIKLMFYIDDVTFLLWIGLTAHHTAETASQSAVFVLHVKAHIHFLPQSIVCATSREEGSQNKTKNV